MSDRDGVKEFVLKDLEPRALKSALMAGIASPHWNALEKQLAQLLLAKAAAPASQRLSGVIGDEINQCLQIIITNAGNIKDDRDGPILEECAAIEDAVKRAAKAVRKLAAPPALEASSQPPCFRCDNPVITGVHFHPMCLREYEESNAKILAIPPSAGSEAAPPMDELDQLAAELHWVYQAEAKRQGDVRHPERYADLPENIRQYDRVLAKFILERQAQRDPELIRKGVKAALEEAASVCNCPLCVEAIRAIDPEVVAQRVLGSTGAAKDGEAT